MHGIRIGALAVAAGVAASLLAPAPAAAHLRMGTVAVDYEASVATPRPSARAPFSVAVHPGDLTLHLSVRSGHTVTVLGYLGEPFIRIGPGGVEVNAASPTTEATKLLPASSARARHGGSGRPAWTRLPGSAISWLDARVSSLAPGASSGIWRVPVLVDGRPAAIVGLVRRLARPMLWPWGLALALFLAAAAALWRTRSPARLARACQLLGAAAAVSGVALAVAFALDGGASAGTWIEGADEVAFAAAGAGALGWAPTKGRIVAGLGLGLLGLAVGLSKGPVFLHGYVLALLPATAARLLAIVAIGAGTAATMLGVLWFTRAEVGARQL